jgi:hypothetical protein
MKLVKVKFFKYGMPSGRDYTYFSEADVKVGDIVELPHSVPQPEGTPYNKGVVTQVDVPEVEIEKFKDKVKTIIGIVPTVPKRSESEVLPIE